jgi:hypothetical protein
MVGMRALPLKTGEIKSPNRGTRKTEAPEAKARKDKALKFYRD